MKKILLIGASGQLGTRIFRKLIKSGYKNIRILVREDSKFEHLLSDHPQVVIGDLRDLSSHQIALMDVDTVIATANTAAPRKKGDRFTSVDTMAYRSLINEAKRQSVKHFIYTSSKPVSPYYEQWIPLCKAKAKVEDHLKKSGLNYTILQPDAFMDVYFTFMGSSLPTLSDEAALVKRDFKFMQKYYRSIKNDMDHGKINIIGDGKTKHNYISVDNTADFIIKALEVHAMQNKIIPIGGPEAISSLEVKAVFEKVLGRTLKIKHTPAYFIKLIGNLLAPFSPAASNIMKLNYLAAMEDSINDYNELAQVLGIKLETAEEFLRRKKAVLQPPVTTISVKSKERMVEKI